MDSTAPPVEDVANATTNKGETLSEFRESHKDDTRRQAQEEILKWRINNTEYREQGNWWFWKPVRPAKEDQQIPVQSSVSEEQQQILQQDLQDSRVELSTSNSTAETNKVVNDRRESWVDWINPSQRVNSVVSYIYAPQNAVESQSSNIQPNQLSSITNSDNVDDNSPYRTLSATTSSKNIESNAADTLLSWFLPWSYFPKNTDTTTQTDRPESMYSSKDSEEIARDAKRAIETNSSENRNSSWAFWSRKNDASGELAVAGTGSEMHPARMTSPPTTFYENQENSLKVPPQPIDAKANLVLPKFDDNYRTPTIKNKARILMSSSKVLKQTFDIKPQTHRYRCKNPRAIKKAVVIGIHGYFPIKMVRTLIGHPTGTSMKFATKATEVFQKWAVQNHIDLEVETIALEGEGRIVERVENLINLLENWIETIQSCDFIYVAAHSQGVMVAIHLISELIARNMVSTKRTQIGMLNMCGVCNGPIVGLDSKLIVKLYSKFENEILMELFDFQDLKSYQSIKLLQSIRNLVSNNVKMTFVGSINDQLSPLYSSLFTVINHPNISRGLFVDKNTNEEAPEFLTKLVEYCIVAQNLGYSECDLIFELSRFANGSLTNGGHSKVYNEDEVYLLGIRNSLETGGLLWGARPVLNISNKEFNAKNVNKNPYHLPWCLRGFMDELVGISNLDGGKMKEDLLKICNDWQPQSKTHKELKYCVEVICQKY